MFRAEKRLQGVEWQDVGFLSHLLIVLRSGIALTQQLAYPSKQNTHPFLPPFVLQWGSLRGWKQPKGLGLRTQACVQYSTDGFGTTWAHLNSTALDTLPAST